MKKLVALLILSGVVLISGCTAHMGGESGIMGETTDSGYGDSGGGSDSMAKKPAMTKPAPTPAAAPAPAPKMSKPAMTPAPKMSHSKKGHHMAGPVRITKPERNSHVSSPVEVCMETSMGYEVEPAKKGVNPKKGHHHLLIDVPLPDDMSKPIGKDANHLHMGDGSKCKEIDLENGIHSIRAVFAKGNHVPYDPPISDVVFVTVK